MESIDRKFRFRAFKVKNPATSVSEKDAMVFKCADNAILDTLDFYYKKSKELRASGQQVRGVELLIRRVERWRRENPRQCKVADIDEGIELATVNAPNEHEY